MQRVPDKASGWGAALPRQRDEPGHVDLLDRALQCRRFDPVASHRDVEPFGEDDADLAAFRAAIVDLLGPVSFGDVTYNYKLDGSGWFGLAGPRDLPPAIAEKLFASLKESYIGKAPQHCNDARRKF